MKHRNSVIPKVCEKRPSKKILGKSKKCIANIKYPINGDEFINIVTGQRYIFQNGKWHCEPCCLKITREGDIVSFKMGENTTELVAIPRKVDNYIWNQQGDSGKWVPAEESLNFFTTSSSTGLPYADTLMIPGVMNAGSGPIPPFGMTPLDLSSVADPFGMFNGFTYFTVPSAGYYNISFNIMMTLGVPLLTTGVQDVIFAVVINGIMTSMINLNSFTVNDVSAVYSTSSSFEVNLSANDIVFIGYTVRAPSLLSTAMITNGRVFIIKTL